MQRDFPNCTAKVQQLNHLCNTSVKLLTLINSNDNLDTP